MLERSNDVYHNTTYLLPTCWKLEQTNRRTDEWTNGRMDEWMDEWTGGRTNY